MPFLTIPGSQNSALVRLCGIVLLTTCAICLLCASLALALPGQSQDKKPVPADKAAFTAARGLSDPQAKLDALRRFIAQYPKSSRVDAANSQILETLVKNFPTRTAELNGQVNTILKHAKGEFRMYDYDKVASTLADGGVLLPRAEQISEKSLKMLNKKSYTTAVRKEYIKAKMKPPNDADQEQQYKTAHSSLQATLGRIYVKEGKTAAGESQLKARMPITLITPWHPERSECSRRGQEMTT